MTTRLLTFFLTLFALSLPASAEGIYALGGIGAAGYAEAETDLNDAINASAVSYGVADKTSSSVKLGVGYRINPNWGVEGGVMGTGTFSRTVGAQTREMKAGALYLSGVYFIPFGDEKDFHLRAGLAGWTLERDYKTSGASVASFKDSGSSLMIGLGFSATFTQNAAIFIDYDFFSTDMVEPGQSREQASFGLLNFGIKATFK